jgi:hypothetical protein
VSDLTRNPFASPRALPRLTRPLSRPLRVVTSPAPPAARDDRRPAAPTRPRPHGVRDRLVLLTPLPVAGFHLLVVLLTPRPGARSMHRAALVAPAAVTPSGCSAVRHTLTCLTDSFSRRACGVLRRFRLHGSVPTLLPRRYLRIEGRASGFARPVVDPPRR